MYRPTPPAGVPHVLAEVDGVSHGRILIHRATRRRGVYLCAADDRHDRVFSGWISEADGRALLKVLADHYAELDTARAKAVAPHDDGISAFAYDVKIDGDTRNAWACYEDEIGFPETPAPDAPKFAVGDRVQYLEYGEWKRGGFVVGFWGPNGKATDDPTGAAYVSVHPSAGGLTGAYLPQDVRRAGDL